MQDLNQIALSGRLTKDAELKYTNSGTALVTMSIANNTRKKEGDNWTDYPNYLDVTFFGRLAEILHPQLTKGCPITLGGRIEQQRWEKDGNKRSKVVVIADHVMINRPKGDFPSEPDF
jgi:single-strand DNA-binding protein